MIKIRKATPLDITRIVYVEESSGYHKKEFNALPIIKKLFKDKYENVFVLEDIDILGYITLRKKNKTGELGLFAITKKAQGKGVGLKLMKFILRYAKRIGCRKVFLDVKRGNIKARSLYNKVGFKVLKIYKKRVDNKSVLKLKMEKILK